jgi:hypothetical protein
MKESTTKESTKKAKTKTTTTKKKQKNNPKNATPCSNNATNIPAVMAELEDYDPDVPIAGGKNNISNNQQFSDNEATVLLDILDEILPIGSSEWKMVCHEFERRSPHSQQKMENLRRN